MCNLLEKQSRVQQIVSAVDAVIAELKLTPPVHMKKTVQDCILEHKDKWEKQIVEMADAMKEVEKTRVWRCGVEDGEIDIDAFQEAVDSPEANIDTDIKHFLHEASSFNLLSSTPADAERLAAVMESASAAIELANALIPRHMLDQSRKIMGKHAQDLLSICAKLHAETDLSLISLMDVIKLIEAVELELVIKETKCQICLSPSKSTLTCSEFLHTICSDCYARNVEISVSASGERENCRRIVNGRCYEVLCKGLFSQDEIVSKLRPDAVVNLQEAQYRMGKLDAVTHTEQKRNDQLAKAEKQSFVDRVVAEESLIVEHFMTAKCPHCSSLFADFDACVKLTCPSCSTVFCGLCLKATPEDPYRHIVSCPKRKFYDMTDAYFCGNWLDGFKKTQNGRLEQYLQSIPMENVKRVLKEKYWMK